MKNLVKILVKMASKFTTKSIIFLILAMGYSHASFAGITDEDKKIATAKVESSILGQRPSIAELIESFSKEGTASLVVGPDGVGKLALVTAVADAYKLNAYAFDMSLPGYSNPENFFFFIGDCVLNNKAELIVLNNIESLNSSAQRSLAILLNQRSVLLNYPAENGKPAQKVTVDLKNTRFAMISDSGEYIFRNPVGFRYNGMGEPETDAFLAGITDQKISNILEASGMQKELLSEIQQFVPVRRLSKDEFRTAVAKTIEENLIALNESIQKPISIDRKNQLIDHLVDKNYIKAHSTYHDINVFVQDALTFRTDEAHFLNVFAKAEKIVLTWDPNVLGTVPEPMSCELISRGKKDNNQIN